MWRQPSPEVGGGHITMIWENGKQAGKPGDNINEGLRRLKEVPRPGLDEFDTLGLGHHRNTREWIPKNKF